MVRAFVLMLPRIEASERLSAITDGAMSSGNMEKRVADKIIRRLEEQASGESRKPAKANPAVLAAMGVGIRSASMPSEKPLSGPGEGNG